MVLLNGKFGDSKSILHEIVSRYGINGNNKIDLLKAYDPLRRNGFSEHICSPNEIKIFNKGLSGSNRFINLFENKLATGISNKPVILRDVFDSDDFGIAIKKGFDFGTNLSSEIAMLFSDAINHIRLISIVDIKEFENQQIGVRPGLCQSVSTHSIPFSIFISPTSLVDSFTTTEAIFHESLHKKLSSIVSIYDIFPENYDFKKAPTVTAIWNPSLKWNSNKWPLDRALFALHFYVHAVYFYEAVNRIHNKPEYLKKYDMQIKINKAKSVSIYLYQELKKYREYLGKDAKELLEWLYLAIEQFPSEKIDYEEAKIYLLLDLHKLWTKELKNYLNHLQDSDKFLVSPTSVEGWTVIEIIRHFFHSEIETTHRFLTVANQSENSKISNYPAEWWAENTTDALSISEYNTLINSLRNYFESIVSYNLKRFNFKKQYLTKKSKRNLFDILYIASNHIEYHIKDLREAILSKDKTFKLDFIGTWNGSKLKDKNINDRFQWLKNHLVDKNVCRYSGPALEQDKFIICSLFYEDTSKIDIKNLFESLAKRYIKLFENIAYFKDNFPPAITVLLPDSFDPSKVFDIEKELREWLITNNIVFGFLSPKTDIRTLTDSNIEYPFKSPYNFITIRYMMEEDKVFFNKNPILLKQYNTIFKNGANN